MKIWECEECGHAPSLSFTDEDVERVAEAICNQWAGGAWDDQGPDKQAMWRGFARAALSAYLNKPTTKGDT